MSDKETFIHASFRLFNHQKYIELVEALPVDPPIEQIIEMILDKLHETEQASPEIKEAVSRILGKETEPEETTVGEFKSDSEEKVFATLEFNEITIDRGGRMIVYRWVRKSMRDAQGFKVLFAEHGKLTMTKLSS